LALDRGRTQRGPNPSKNYRGAAKLLNCAADVWRDNGAMENPNAALFATETAPGTAWACTLEGIAMEIPVRAGGTPCPGFFGIAAMLARLRWRREAPSSHPLAAKG